MGFDVVGVTAQELEGILYKLKRRLRRRLPPECYRIVEEEFKVVEAYIEEKKAEAVPI